MCLLGRGGGGGWGGGREGQGGSDVLTPLATNSSAKDKHCIYSAALSVAVSWPSLMS